jgi:hypothetical protein
MYCRRSSSSYPASEFAGVIPRPMPWTSGRKSAAKESLQVLCSQLYASYTAERCRLLP